MPGPPSGASSRRHRSANYDTGGHRPDQEPATPRSRRNPRQLAAGFYEALFSTSPNLRALFPGDLTSLQGHFEAAVALVVRNLDEMSALRESLRELGGEHVHWGARPEDYETAREALIIAVRRLSSEWNADARRRLARCDYRDHRADARGRRGAYRGDRERLSAEFDS